MAQFFTDFIVTINEQNVTGDILFPTFKVTDHVNQQVDKATFKTRDYKPALGQEIAVTFKDEKIFGGVVISVTTEQKSQTQIHTVKCKDYSHLLGRKLVLKRYENTTVNAIIAELLTDYAPDFTNDFVVAPVTIGSISFNRITAMEALQRLAEIVNYSWYVDYDKNIHFFALNQEPAPFNLTENGKNHIWNSLKTVDDFSQIRNQIYVVGGEFEGEERSESYIADGTQEQFPLAYKFSEKPVVKVATVEQTVGIDGIDNEGSFDCFWNFSGKYIRFQFEAPPAKDDVIEVTGIPLLPIIVRLTNPSSIAQHGVFEFKIEDETISNRNDAVERARAELNAYKQSISEGSFQTYRNGLRSGQIINVNVNGVSEQYIIQRVDFAMRTQDEGIWNVDMATVRTLGIIQFLQGLLRTKTQIDASEILLNLEQFTDSVEVSDTVVAPSRETAPPYKWANATDPADEFKWNFFTWS